MIDPVSALHGLAVHRRRVRKLAEGIAPLLPDSAEVLDVGCGDGQLGALLSRVRPDTNVQGVDVLIRPMTHIDVRPFDGQVLPFADGEFSVVLLVDVLHHCDEPMALMRECARVARTAVVIKDHLADGLLATMRLRCMDFVGNAGHGVALPYNYWKRDQWSQAFAALGWGVNYWSQRLYLYPGPAEWLFGRDLHFLAYCRLSTYADRQG